MIRMIIDSAGYCVNLKVGKPVVISKTYINRVRSVVFAKECNSAYATEQPHRLMSVITDAAHHS